MADVKAGGAYVELSLRVEAFQKAMAGVERKLAAFSKNLKTAGTALAGIGAAGAGAFLPTIKAASDAQEQISKFNTVFGSASSEVLKFSDTLAAELGRGKTQILSFLASSQDLFVPIGFDKKTAEDLSKTVTKLAVDLASFNNITDTKALDDLQAALTGSGEVMKKYGVLVNEAAVKQRLLNSAIDPALASDQQKVLARLAIILDGTTAAQGDAIRTAGSFANQLKRLRSEIDNAATSLGNSLLPVITDYVSRLSEVIKQADTYISRNVELVKNVAAATVAVTALGAALITTSVAINAVTVATAALSTTVGVLAGVVTALSNPVVLVGTVLAGLVATLDGVQARFSSFSETVSTSLGAIASAVGRGEITKAFSFMFSSIDNLLTDALTGIGQSVATLLLDLAETIISFADNNILLTPLKAIAAPFAALSAGMQNSINALTLRVEESRNAMNSYVEAAKGVANANEKIGSSAASAGAATASVIPDLSAAGGGVDTKSVSDEQERIKRESQQLFDSTRTEYEKFRIEVQRIGDLYNRGAITSEVYRRAIKAQREELHKATGVTDARIRQEEEARRVIDSTKTAVEKYNEEVGRYSDLQKAGLINQDTLFKAIANARKELEQNDEAFQKHNKALERGKQLFDENKTAAEKYRDAMSELTQLKKQGAISDETFRRAQEKAQQSLEGAATETNRIPTVLSTTGGQRASQIFGTSDLVAKQQLTKLNVIADESKRTRQAIERNALVFQ